MRLGGRCKWLKKGGGAFSIYRLAGGVHVACCTFAGRVLTLWVLVRELSYLLFSGYVQEQGFSPFYIHESSGLRTLKLSVRDFGNGFL